MIDWEWSVIKREDLLPITFVWKCEGILKPKHNYFLINKIIIFITKYSDVFKQTNKGWTVVWRAKRLCCELRQKYIDFYTIRVVFKLHIPLVLYVLRLSVSGDITKINAQGDSLMNFGLEVLNFLWIVSITFILHRSQKKIVTWHRFTVPWRRTHITRFAYNLIFSGRLLDALYGT